MLCATVIERIVLHNNIIEHLNEYDMIKNTRTDKIELPQAVQVLIKSPLRISVKGEIIETNPPMVH